MNQHYRRIANDSGFVFWDDEEWKPADAIVENTEIMSKIENDYQKKKRESTDLEERKMKESYKSFGDDKKKKKKDENCLIF